MINKILIFVWGILSIGLISCNVNSPDEDSSQFLVGDKFEPIPIQTEGLSLINLDKKGFNKEGTVSSEGIAFTIVPLDFKTLATATLIKINGVRQVKDQNFQENRHILN